MMRLMISMALSAIGNAIGLLVATMIFSDFRVNLLGFIVSVLFFTLASAVLAPFIFKVAIKYLPALRGGIALITILIVLILTVMFTDGITIGSISTWVMAPLVIWLSTVVAGVVLPMFIFKETVRNIKANQTNNTNG